MLVVFCVPFKSDEEFTSAGPGGEWHQLTQIMGLKIDVTSFRPLAFCIHDRIALLLGMRCHSKKEHSSCPSSTTPE